MLFADLGAEVIKIEPPEGEMIRDNPPGSRREGGPTIEPQRLFPLLNRNKYGITLNLKHPKAVTIFKDLVKISDVVLENYARGDETVGNRLRRVEGGQPPDHHVRHQRVRTMGPYSEKIAFDIIGPGDERAHVRDRVPDTPPTRRERL